MKTHILAAGAAALALGTAGIASAASAPCVVTYQHPAKASQIKASLVQAFVSCNNAGGNNSNSSTETGTTPTCYPAETVADHNGAPPLTWTWGPKSQGSVSFKAGKNKLMADPSLGPEDPYPQNTDPNAVDLYIQVKISDIHDNTGLADGVTGSVNSVARATLIDRAENKLMTVIDFPTGFDIPCNNGKVSQKTSATVILDKLNQPALPACTTIELITTLIRDPNGNTFANLGTFLP